MAYGKRPGIFAPGTFCIEKRFQGGNGAGTSFFQRRALKKKTSPALFTAIFVSQWQATENHTPAVLGIVIPLLCLLLIGPQSFIPPAMLLLLLVFITAYYKGGIKL